MKIFNRYWSIKVRTNPVFDFVPPFEFEIKPDQNDRSLRAQFEINASRDFRYYSGTIKIYNLSAEKRSRLSFNLLGDEVGTGPSVQFTAGYKDKNGLIFNGAIFRGWSVRESGNWITTMEVSIPMKQDFNITIPEQPVSDENLYNFLFATVDKIKDQPNRIGINYGPNYAANFRRAINEYLVNGNLKNKSLGYSGTSSSILAEISAEFNIAFFQDHNGWNAIGGKYATSSNQQNPLTLPDGATDPTFIFTPKTGLLGSPIYTDTGAKILTYLRPDLRLFQLIGIRSESLNRNVSILELRHRGDTHTDEWYSEIDASAINQFIRK